MTDYSKLLLYSKHQLHSNIMHRLQHDSPAPTLTSRCMLKMYRFVNSVLSINIIQSILLKLICLFPKTRRYLDPPSLWINALEMPNPSRIRLSPITQLDIPISRIMYTTKHLTALFLRETNHTSRDYTTIRSLLGQLEATPVSNKDLENQIAIAKKLMLQVWRALDDLLDFPNRGSFLFQVKWVAETLPILLVIVATSNGIKHIQELQQNKTSNRLIDPHPRNHHEFLTKSVNAIVQNTKMSIEDDLITAQLLACAIYRETMICCWLQKIEKFKVQQVSTLFPFRESSTLKNIERQLALLKQSLNTYRDQLKISLTGIEWIYLEINHRHDNKTKKKFSESMSLSVSDQALKDMMPESINYTKDMRRYTFITKIFSVISTIVFNKLIVKVPLSTLQPWLAHMYGTIEHSLTQPLQIGDTGSLTDEL